MTRPELVIAADASALPDYPFGREHVLPGQYFLKWETGRWLTSDMYLRADPEVGYAYLNLIFTSQAARPIGTIPADAAGQAALLRYDLARWQKLCRSDPSPLRHWRPYLCDGGEVRLGHPVVIDMIGDQLARRDAAVARREGEAVRKRIDRLRQALRERGVHHAVLADSTLMERMDGWLCDHVRGRRDVRAYDRVMVVAGQEGWFATR